MPLITLQAAGLACGLIGVRWSSAIVLPEILGSFGLLIGTHLFATTVTHQGLIQHVQRYWTTETFAPRYIALVALPSLRPTLVLATALIVVWGALRLIDPAIGPGWWCWMLGVNLLAATAGLGHAALQAEQRYWPHCIASIIGSATRSFLPLLLIIMAGNGTLALLGAGFFAHTALWSLAAVFFLRTAWRRPAAPAPAATAPPDQIISAFMLVGVFAWLGASAFRFFAAVALDAITTGYFILAANLASIVPSTISVISQSYMFPQLYSAARGGATPVKLLRITEVNLFTALIVGQFGLLVLAWCSPWLVGLAIHARYGPSTEWLLAAGGAVLATTTGAFYCMFFISQNRERPCLWLTAASAGFRVATTAVLAFVGNDEWFRIGLSLLPWPTVALEYWLVRRWMTAKP